MTHARTFTVPPAADPIHAAIERHRAAYDAFQVALEGEAALFAEDDYDAATDALVSTACATRFGALALLGHLRWWLVDEAEFKAGHQPGYGIAEARVADLTLFLGTHLPPAVIPHAMPSGRLGMPATCALDPRRATRVLMLTGEAMAAVAIIAGGVVLTGLATLL